MTARLSCKHLIISGRVQGVGYRSWTVGQAKKRGLSGWVRNRTDGTVEAVIFGDSAALATMIETCRKGPLAAKVTDIVITDSDETHEGVLLQRETV